MSCISRVQYDAITESSQSFGYKLCPSIVTSMAVTVIFEHPSKLARLK